VPLELIIDCHKEGHEGTGTETETGNKKRGIPPSRAMFMVFQEVADQKCGWVSLVVLTFAHAAAKPC